MITESTNYSPFESEAVVENARELFVIGEHAEDHLLQPGQMSWTALDLTELTGKRVLPNKGTNCDMEKHVTN